MVKFSFDKRCPFCKNISYKRIERNTWMRTIPGTKYYSCYNCSHTFVSFFGISNIFEHRRHKRYQVRDDIFISLGPSETYPISDLSKWGLSFFYTTDEERVSTTGKLDILHKAGSLCLKEMPFKVVLDLEFDDGPTDNNEKTRRCGIQFMSLVREQKSSIKTFITKYQAGKI